MGYGVCKIGYWAPKGAEIAAEMQKKTLKGSKIRKSAISHQSCLYKAQDLANVEN